ncbi:methylenetetrahydrofolate reductase (NADPH) [Lachnospiraceae bacterium PFB1-21]
MRIDELFKKKKPVVSFEVFPPKKAEGMKKMEETLDILSELGPDFISVTFGAGGSSNNNRTIELAKMIKERSGVSPVVHLTSLHYDRGEIDEFADVLRENGLENVLALRGDQNPNVQTKKDFKYASDLTAYLKEKNYFCIGGGCYPEVHPEAPGPEEDLQNLKKKVESGCDFLVSQLFFDNDNFMAFKEQVRAEGITTPITAGIMPATNKAGVERMVSLCGAQFPERFQRIVNKYENNKEGLFEAGIYYAISQVIDLIARDVEGIHIYTLNNPVIARKITEGIKYLI